MKLNVLPLVECELRVAARRQRTAWTRLTPVIVAIGIAFWSLLSVGGLTSPGQIGASLFTHLSIVTLLACLSAGPFLTSDCLSREKREGTLGLLFLTDLKKDDVIFGKLIGASLNALYSLFAILPILAIPLVLGGVAAGEYWRTAAALLNALFWSLAVGLLVSASCKREYVAMGLTTGVVVGAGVLLPALGVASHVMWLGWMMEQMSPVLTLRAALASNYSLNPWAFYTSLCVVHLLAWGCLLVSPRLLAWKWSVEILGRTVTSSRMSWQRWRLGNAEKLRARRTRLLERNPTCWLGSRGRFDNLHIWLITLAAIGFCGAFSLMSHGTVFGSARLSFLGLIAVHGVLKVLMASEAARRLANDRECGILSIVLSTRMTVEEIIRGQILTLHRRFVGPVTVVLLWDVLESVAVAVGAPSGSGLPAGLPMVVAMVLICDLAALAWVGLWLGFKTQKAGRATLGALLRVVVLPSLFVPFVFLGSRFANAAFMWFFISALFDGVFMLYAWMKLHDEFRFQLTELPPKPSDFDEDFALLKWTSVERRQAAAV